MANSSHEVLQNLYAGKEKKPETDEKDCRNRSKNMEKSKAGIAEK